MILQIYFIIFLQIRMKMHLLVGIKWSCTKKEKEGKESVLITKIFFFFCSEGWTSAVTLASAEHDHAD